jgi:hypothetical protein
MNLIAEKRRASDMTQRKLRNDRIPILTYVQLRTHKTRQNWLGFCKAET